MTCDGTGGAAKSILGLHVPTGLTDVTGFAPQPLFTSFRLRLESLQITITGQHPFRCIRLHNLFAHDHYRGQGTGTQVMRALTRYGDALGSPIWLYVNATGATPTQRDVNSGRLIRWYRTFGFVEPSDPHRRSLDIRCYSLQRIIRQPRG